MWELRRPRNIKQLSRQNLRKENEKTKERQFDLDDLDFEGGERNKKDRNGQRQIWINPNFVNRLSRGKQRPVFDVWVSFGSIVGQIKENWDGVSDNEGDRIRC